MKIVYPANDVWYYPLYAGNISIDALDPHFFLKLLT